VCTQLSRRPQATKHVASGFTLLELTLVLALLVVLAAIVWPAFERPLASQRLQQGADKIRAEWTRTRVRAMTSGSPHVFRYQPLTNQYQIEVWHGAEAQLEASSVSDFGTPLESAVVSQGLGEDGLPDGVLFDANQTLQEVRGMFVGAEAVASRSGEAAWSDPIYFFPDGTTSTARLLLRNEYELYIILDLRGLTGVTTVSEVMTADELPQ
jgi:prepilin-type N-terminal cleavage/methylation domain-containing protein